jgi:hypothetical protein
VGKCAERILVKPHVLVLLQTSRQGVERKVENLIRADQDPKKAEANSRLVNNQNVGTVARLSTLRRIARNQGRRLGTILQTW